MNDCTYKLSVCTKEIKKETCGETMGLKVWYGMGISDIHAYAQIWRVFAQTRVILIDNADPRDQLHTRRNLFCILDNQV